MLYLRSLAAARLGMRFNGHNGNALRRGLSAKPTSGQPTWPLYLSIAGCLGLGGYVYMEWNAKTPEPLPKDKSPLDPDNFIDFRLKRVDPYNHNTSKFTFDLPDQQSSLLPVASCVIVRASDPLSLQDKNGKPIIRPYTPISSPHTPGELTFLVKKYETGNASKYIHSLKVGDTLAVKGPIKKWDYKINEFDEVALIGGGSGITPLFQIVNYALPHKENKTRFTLIFANVTEQDILLREEFDTMRRKYPDTFNVIYTLDKPEKSWQGPRGFVDEVLLKQHLAPPTLENKVKIFVCGPPGQMAAVSGKKDGMKQGEIGGILQKLGYSADQVFKF